MRHLAALIAGLLFGLGLVVAEMTNPAKVQGFLDVFGRWDASLALVMVGAIGVHALLLRLIRPARPLYAEKFALPRGAQGAIDRPLVVGALVFGVGWGLAGFCPGPALVAFAAAAPAALLFVPAMLAGMWLSR